MERIYLPEAKLSASLLLSKEHSRYLTQVHRLSVGDKLLVFDGVSSEYLAQIIRADKSVTEIEILELKRTANTAKIKISLAQSLPKNGKMETVVQKACELGVDKIYPFNSHFSQVKRDAKRSHKKTLRYNKIVEEACRQCGRIKLATVFDTVEFEDVLAMCKTHQVLLAYEGSRTIPLATALDENPPDEIVIVIGPEGGFAEHEIDMAKDQGAVIISMGPRVLRTETAPLAMLSVIQYVWGDLGGFETPAEI